MYKIYSNGLNIKADVINDAIENSSNEDIIFLAVRGRRINRSVLFGPNMSMYEIQSGMFLKFLKQENKNIVPPIIGLVKEEFYEEKTAIEVLKNDSRINTISYVNKTVANTTKKVDTSVFNGIATKKTITNVRPYNKSIVYIRAHNSYVFIRKIKNKLGW